ncbi:MAG TPA: glycosyltransferase family 4 protein [Nocardioides sp.]|nr:glycosyltransferase family 4 protein [Nocardioides sp.]
MSQSERGRPRVGYVLKMYPRFSETFIVNEVLALEAAGECLDLFSLRSPVDGRFHGSLAEVRAPVTYLRTNTRAEDAWQLLREGLAELPSMREHLADVLALPHRDATGAVQLAIEVRRRGIDHLHAHFGSIATEVARVSARLAGISYSFTAHAKDIFHSSVDPVALREKLSDASAVVTVSDYNLRYLQTTYGDAADRVVRIYNGLDLDRFPFASPETRPPVVVGVGRLVEKKGFTHLVDAVAQLVRDGRNVRLDLVGDGAEEVALRAQVGALGLDGVVRFLGGLPQQQVREVVQQAAVLAAPCVVGTDGNRDGLPTVLLEAMALGTPCVATPVTGIPEVVRPDRTGLSVPPGDVPGLATALGRLLDDSRLRVALAAQARTLIEREFDVGRTSGQLRDVLGAAARRPVPAEVL